MVIQANPAKKQTAMTNNSTRISRSEILDLRETIHASGPLPTFGAGVLGLFLCMRLTLTYPRSGLLGVFRTVLVCVSGCLLQVQEIAFGLVGGAIS